MKLSLTQKFQLAFHDIKDAIFPDRQLPVGSVVASITGNGALRVIDSKERGKVITALKSNGYKDPDEALRAFETLATAPISWTNDPR